jgi:2-oxoglutarate dehydrogenase E1 component
MYERIRQKRPAHELYGEKLTRDGVLGEADAEMMRSDIKKGFDRALDYAREQMPRQKIFAFGGAWEGLSWAGKDWSADTAVPERRLFQVLQASTSFPKEFHAHPKVAKLFEQRRAMVDGDGQIDWACAEMLAFGTLLAERMNVRLSGQDSERGTFSQRHAVLHDLQSNKIFVPLNAISTGQGHFTIINSMLSEEGVLGFEYGFSTADPRNLVCWEAQFGDFANEAQVVIDQFIASAESKWQRQSGIVLLLPHGYEGQGPEHSSARLERFLQLCGEKNMQVCYPTTPAQYFHVLRRQMHRKFRKPLIVMTPKSLLRHKLVVSKTNELTQGTFEPVIDDPTMAENPERTQRLLLCTGKVYYDLFINRHERAIENMAIVRIEQLYPFPYDELRAIVERYPTDMEVYWVQEEPKNMGAWRFVEPRLRQIFGSERRPSYVGRDTAASPATGSYRIHQQEHEKIINEALKKVGTPAKQAHAG